MKMRPIVIVGMILMAAAARLLPHPWNVTPLGAIALFGGARLSDRRLSMLVPLAALFVSDVVIGLHVLMPVVYAAFALIVCLGWWLGPRRGPAAIAGATLAGSVLFFLITNFGVWALGAWYPKTPEGLAACYVAGIPYFWNTLFGDAFYATVLFGGLALADRRFSGLGATD